LNVSQRSEPKAPELKAGARAIVVSFSGIDGAGKSTQINHLVDFIRQSGGQLAVISFWDQVVALRKLREFTSHSVFKGEKGVGSPDRPVRRRDKNVRSRLMTLARCAFYLLDALNTHLVLSRFRSRCDVLIFDRYLYDELANLPLTSPFVRMYVQLLLRLTPRPDIAYLLDADPQKAIERKPEYPLEFVVLNHLAYLSLAQQMSGMVVIGAGPEEAVQTQVLQAIIGMLDMHLSQHSMPTSHRSLQGLHMVRRANEDLSGNHIPAQSRGVE
jgi:thymidylate kinase